MASIVPGIFFNEGEILTPVKLNLMMVMLITIKENEITADKVGEELLPPTSKEIAGSYWELIPNRADQFGIITLDGDRALIGTGLETGMCGTLIVQQDGVGGHSLDLPSGSIVAGNGNGSVALASAPYAITVLQWWFDGLNVFWAKGGEV